MSSKIKILLADDHQIVRMGLASILQPERDLVLVGEATNGTEAVELVRKLNPDVVLMDLMMPEKDGATATAEIRAARPDVKVLVLTTFGESEEVRRALAAGAAGALIKNTPHKILLAAIRQVAAGERVLSPEIDHLLNTSETAASLTPRQVEILRYTAQGLPSKGIAREIGISANGINAHFHAIFEKLGASSRAEAVAIALRKRLLTL